MKKYSYLRGHKVFWDKTNWFYYDNKEPVDDLRPCIRCGKLPTVEGYDACLNKEGCCGHGIQINPEDDVILNETFLNRKLKNDTR